MELYFRFPYAQLSTRKATVPFIITREMKERHLTHCDSALLKNNLTHDIGNYFGLFLYVLKFGANIFPNSFFAVSLVSV
jgi:hypothetical protein